MLQKAAVWALEIPFQTSQCSQNYGQLVDKMANGANSMVEKNDLSHEWLPFILLHEWLADFLLQPGAWDEGTLEEGTYLAKELQNASDGWC